MLDTLPFSPPRQDALLGHLLYDEKFFRQAKGRIEPNWFVDPYASKVWKAKTDFFTKYNRSPTVPELKEWQGFMAETQADRNKILGKINQAMIARESYGADSLATELTDWMHARIYATNVMKSQDLFNKQKFGEAYDLLKQMSKTIDTTSFMNDREASFDTFVQDFEEAEKDLTSALTFGHSFVDHYLLPGSQHGGLLAGDTTVILAPTNVGKTTVSITMICHNLRKSKSVLFLAHEGTESDLKSKIWCSLMRVSKAELLEFYKTEEGSKRMQRFAAHLQKYLTFVHYPRAGATIEEIESLIRRKQDERIAKYGTPYDIVVDDYPAKLTSIQARGGQWGKRNIDELVYGYFVALGLEYRSHMFLPVQTNRNGSKINKFGGEDDDKRLLVGEDVQESWGVITQATNVITLNRDPVAERLGYITFYIDKSRSNEKGFAVVCKTDYGRATTHDNTFGAVAYKGQQVITHRRDFQAIFDRYRDGEVPDHVLMEE